MVMKRRGAPGEHRLLLLRRAAAVGRIPRGPRARTPRSCWAYLSARQARHWSSNLPAVLPELVNGGSFSLHCRFWRTRLFVTAFGAGPKVLNTCRFPPTTLLLT